MATYNTFHTEQFRKVQDTLTRKHSAQIKRVIKQMQDTLTVKGRDYNNLHSMPEHLIFGDKSWATLLTIKAHRIASVIDSDQTSNESLDDSILDLANYAAAYLAWRQVIQDE